MEALQELEAPRAGTPAGGTARPAGSVSAPGKPSVTPGASGSAAGVQGSAAAAKGGGGLPEDLAALSAQSAAASEALMRFVTAHPYLIAPNVYRMWEENLKEVCVSIERQLNNARQKEQSNE